MPGSAASICRASLCAARHRHPRPAAVVADPRIDAAAARWRPLAQRTLPRPTPSWRAAQGPLAAPRLMGAVYSRICADAGAGWAPPRHRVSRRKAALLLAGVARHGCFVMNVGESICGRRRAGRAVGGGRTGARRGQGPPCRSAPRRPAAVAAAITIRSLARPSTTAITSFFRATRQWRDYLASIGAPARCTAPTRRVSRSTICATASAGRWRLNDGPLPWWLLRKAAACRAPARRLSRAGALLLRGRRERRIGDGCRRSRAPFWERLIEPMMLAVLNTGPEEGSAGLAGAVPARDVCARRSRLPAAIADADAGRRFHRSGAALAGARGAASRSSRGCARSQFAGDRVAALDFGEATEPVHDAAVVLAVPPWVAGELVPELVVPDRFLRHRQRPFRLARAAWRAAMIGLLAAPAQWLLCSRTASR